MGPEQLLLLQVRVDLGVMAMKEYSTLSRTLEQEPHYQMQFSVIPRTPFFFEGVLPLCKRCNQYILHPASKLEVSQEEFITTYKGISSGIMLSKLS